MINILEYFEITIREIPNKIAVIDGDRRISFKELYDNAISMASGLDFKNKPIAVLLPKSIECVIADLAIIYSGNIYMNLDIKAPTKRIENILSEIHPVLVIDEKYMKEEHPFLYREFSTIDTDPLCIINTSGSTGTPKGVVLNHRSFIDFTEWAYSTFDLRDEIIGSLSPSVFDIYSFEFCMMLRGSTIMILDSYSAYPADLLTKMRDVTFIFWVPSIMVTIANMDLLSKIHLPQLKIVWFAGEVFPTRQFNYWYRNLPDVQFTNLYGPIEITLDCTYFIVSRELDDSEPIPIGIPCRNTDIIILDEELCVRGTSLAMGYYNNPEKTKEAFIQNPLNNSYPEIIYKTGDYVLKNSLGELIFRGRRDTLIKHRGYRIELTEIEHVIINTLKLTDYGCVVYRNGQIVFYYENDINVTEAREKILSVLPKYMLPDIFIKMEIPKNANGKINRLILNGTKKNI